MIREWIPGVGDCPMISFDDMVLITGVNGALTKKKKGHRYKGPSASYYSGSHIVIDLMLAGQNHIRYQFAAITIDDGYYRYYHNYVSRTRAEFLDIVKEKYPQFFEYLLFHPEFTK